MFGLFLAMGLQTYQNERKNKMENINKVQAGDYICYQNKNELGKVKRIRDERCVFAWFHTGDTASCINKELFTVVLPASVAKNMSLDMVVATLKRNNFWNDYAIEEIVKKGECVQ